MTNPNASVSPVHGGYNDKGECFDDPRNGILQGGLTKREHFAAMAMQGLSDKATVHYEFNEYAEMAVKIADALIAALNKEVPGE